MTGYLESPSSELWKSRSLSNVKRCIHQSIKRKKEKRENWQERLHGINLRKKEDIQNKRKSPWKSEWNEKAKLVISWQNVRLRYTTLVYYLPLLASYSRRSRKGIRAGGCVSEVKKERKIERQNERKWTQMKEKEKQKKRCRKMAKKPEKRKMDINGRTMRSTDHLAASYRPWPLWLPHRVMLLSFPSQLSSR